jgi:hypothetical protein
MSLPQPNTGLRWPVAAKRTIDAPALAVWAAISMPGNLEPCHPYCAKNPVQSWPGPKSSDKIEYLNGLVYERHFSQWYEGTGYDLQIRRRDELVASVSWRISAIDDQSCVLTITVYPYLLQNIPLPFRWLPHLLRLRPLLRRYLESVTRGFDWYVTRGEPVPRDQFGKHPWFSNLEPFAG